jgi:hypothetical protein
VPGLAGVATGLAGVVTGLAAFCAPPHPMTVVANAPSSNRLSRACVRRRRKGNPKNRNAARALPPPSANTRLCSLGKAVAAWPVALDGLLAAVVLTVSVAVTAAVPVMAGGAAKEQVGRSTAVAGPVTVQESATEPVKPPLGVIVIVEVPLTPGVAMLTVVLVSAKFGAGAGGGGEGERSPLLRLSQYWCWPCSTVFCAQPPNLRFATLMDMNFAVSCPLVPR